MSLKKQWVGVLLSCALISCSKREQERDEQGLRTTLGEQGVHEKSKNSGVRGQEGSLTDVDATHLNSRRDAENGGGESGEVPRSRPALNLRVLPRNVNSRNLFLEPSDWEDYLEVETLLGENEIQILNTLVVNELPADSGTQAGGRTQDFFLSWQNNWRGQRIRSVQFQHRVELPGGSYIISHQTQSVSFDHSRQLYSISSAQLFSAQYQPWEADPTHLQLIRLDVLLENGSRSTLDIRFRMCGPIPELRRESQFTVSQLSYQQWVDAIRDDQKVEFLSESFENPTGRDLHFWIQALEPDSSSRLKVFVDFLDATDRNLNELVLRTGRKTYITGLRLKELKVLRASPGQPVRESVIQIVPGQWLRLDLGAHESFILKWMLKKERGMAGEVLPVNQPKRVMVNHERALYSFHERMLQVVRVNQSMVAGDELTYDGNYWKVFRQVQSHHRLVGSFFESGLRRTIRLGYGFRSPDGLVESSEWSQVEGRNALRNYRTLAEPIPNYQFCVGDCTPSREARDVFQGRFIL